MTEKYPSPKAKSEVTGDQASEGEGVEKGRRMGRGRLDKFKTALTALTELLKELEGSEDDEQMFKKDESDDDEKHEKLLQKIADLTKMVNDANSEIAKLRKMPDDSNSLEVEGKDSSDEKFTWPLDMNRPITKEAAGDDWFGE